MNFQHAHSSSLAASVSRSSRHLSLWLAAGLAACSSCAFAFAVLAVAILPELQLPATTLGLFAALLWTVAAASAFVAGRWSHRLRAWTGVRLAVLCCAAGVLIAADGRPWAVVAGAILVGVGQGLEGPPAFQILARHIPPARQAFWFSVKQSGIQAGAIAAALVLPALAAGSSWQLALVVLGVAVLLLVAALSRAAACWPVALGPVAPATSRKRPSGRNAEARRLGWTALAYAAVQASLHTFLPIWLVQERGLGFAAAGLVVGLVQLAALVSRPLFGALVSREAGGLPMLVGLGLAMSGCAAAVMTWGVDMPLALLVLLLPVFGLVAGGWNGVLLAQAAAGASQHEVAARTSAALVQVFIGLVVGPLVFSGATQAGGMPAGFGVLALAALAGTCTLLMRPRVR